MQGDGIVVPPHVKGLIFDCDGTLADSMPLHMAAWENAFSDFGEVYRKDYLLPLRGLSEQQIVEMYNSRFSRSLDPDALVARKHTYFRETIHLIEPIEPVVDVARRHHGRLPMAVVSGGRREMVERTLEVLGIDTLFEAVLTADDPYPLKQEPEIFLAAARLLGVEPSRCQVFEDGEIGLESARKAGMVATDIRPYIAAEGEI